MLERKKDITLGELNRITHAWIEMDYHQQVHSSTLSISIIYLDLTSIKYRGDAHFPASKYF
jgi:hypothetical protein